jgi:hypothetical protein
MQIAEDLVRSGATAGVAFKNEIIQMIKMGGFTKIIETGTYHGTGTTRAVLQGVDKSKPFDFISIECNPVHVEIARKNTGKMEGFTILEGLSVPKRLLPKKLNLKGYPDDTIVDHREKDRERLYKEEVNFNCPDELLRTALEMQGGLTELFILDSAGHMGTVEFDYLMGIVRAPFMLALDDTLHIKHRKTVEKIKNDPRFTLTFETAEKFGSRIYAVQMG